MKYVVTGPQRVAETAKGEEINLDPRAASTKRLIKGGHIARPPKNQPASKPVKGK